MASVDVVIPVLNEEHSLGRCIERLSAFLRANLDHEWRIVVADNGSSDATLEVASRYAQERPGEVSVTHLDERGRGRALKRAWLESEADVVSYMDVDLSTGLDAFPPLVAAVADEGRHVAWGSRLSSGSRTERSLKREVISRSYVCLIRLIAGAKFRDAQCGFKAMSREAAATLLPLIKDNAWFFDTELLVVAHKRGFRCKEIPVQWEEDPDSRVKILKTSLQSFLGLLRLRFKGLPDVRPPA